MGRYRALDVWWGVVGGWLLRDALVTHSWAMLGIATLILGVGFYPYYPKEDDR